MNTEMIKRGYIYKWREGKYDERNVLVVSANHRGNEKLISVLMFGSYSEGRDVVEIKNDILGDTRYLHCGMLTYVGRQDLSESPTAQISEKKMAQVEKQLCIQLGITNEETIAELKFYKRQCNELIEKIIGLNIDL